MSNVVKDVVGRRATLSAAARARPDAAARAAVHGLGVLLLTSVHHAYGAYVYQTPWRYHAVFISVAAGLMMLGSLVLLRRSAPGLTRTLAKTLFVLTILVVPVVAFGAFEGVYNHVLKNLLHFGGAPASLMTWLFPAPRYELPNDVFFELTGMLQAVPALFAALNVARMFRDPDTLAAAANGKVHAGMVIAPRELVSISGVPVPVPDAGGPVHLQFRRFAGCPVCNLHLRSVVRRHDEIRAAGMREVVVFYSTAAELRKYEGDLPFAVIADPGRRLYAEFGVSTSPRAVLDVRAWVPIVRAVWHKLVGIVRRGEAVPPIMPDGGSLGLPADFLIDSDGRVLACRYGRHADDQWSVDELLELRP